jgi:hypothetical protein
MPTTQDRYQPLQYRQPAVQVLYLATNYTTPNGVSAPPATSNPSPDPAPPAEPIDWSSSPDQDSPAFEITGSSSNYEPSRNMQLGVDPDTDQEDNLACNNVGLDWGPGLGWTRGDCEYRPVLPAGTVATSTGGPLLIQPEPLRSTSSIVPSAPAQLSDEDDDDGPPPLLDVSDVVPRLVRLRPMSPELTLLSPTASDEDDLFDPPTPSPKRRRLFQSFPPQ